jgi:uncharacterized RDD family membrane protein YckC
MNYELGSPLNRFIAFVIDWLVLFVINLVLGAIFQGSALGTLITVLLGFGYHWYCWTKRNGQTVGHGVMGLKVIKKGGGAVDDMTAVLRYLGYIVSAFILGLGFLLILIDAEKQGLHDKIAGTLVVKA